VEQGLRARKKEQTRQLIGDAARRLFAERGFDRVTVADVAREADVSEGTVFNYFPRKEDLFYGQMEAFEAELIDAVRDRAPGESVVAAFRAFVIDRSVRLEADEVADVIAAAAGMIGASAALRAREREIVAESTLSLAALIAGETGAEPDDVVPWVVANALMGAQRGLVEYVRGRVLAGGRGPELAADVRAQGERAFARLQEGLAGFATGRGQTRQKGRGELVAPPGDRS
jgi:AcrR family transcriptional regulator